MEACNAYEPWHDKRSHQTFLRHTSGKCLHYYFYFIDDTLGLIYLRVPTWCPFWLQFYCNGRSWLVRSLAAVGIGYTMADNAFIRLGDGAWAQQLVDGFSQDMLHAIRDCCADQHCPVLAVFGQGHHWSLMQVEYATDLAIRSDAVMKPLYDELPRQVIFSVKAEQVVTFLGKKITPQLAQEIGCLFATRIEGFCVNHYLGKVSVTMYATFGRVLRLKTTTNDVSFFQWYRKVEHRDGHLSCEIAPVKNTIYSLIDLRELLSCNRRYLEYLSALDDFSAGDRNLHGLSNPKTVNGDTLKAFNLFDRMQQILLRALQRPTLNSRGICQVDLAPFLPHVSGFHMTRYLWRLRQFGLIKQVAHSYRNYLTKLGRSAITAACRITEHVVVPALAGTGN